MPLSEATCRRSLFPHIVIVILRSSFGRSCVNGLFFFLSSFFSHQRAWRMRREPEVKRKCQTKRDFCQQNGIPTAFCLFSERNLMTLTMWIWELITSTISISRIKGKRWIFCYYSCVGRCSSSTRWLDSKALCEVVSPSVTLSPTVSSTNFSVGRKRTHRLVDICYYASKWLGRYCLFYGASSPLISSSVWPLWRDRASKGHSFGRSIEWVMCVFCRGVPLYCQLSDKIEDSL